MRMMLTAAAFLLTAAAPPPAPVQTVTDDYYGTKVRDDYRWMESGKDPRWMPWLRAQAEHARTTLTGLPGRAALLQEISARSGGLAAVSSAQMAGGMMLSLQRAANAEDFKLMIQRGKTAPSVLVDPATAVPGSPMVLDSFRLSPDGKTAAVLMSKRGTERAVLHFVDTATGRIAPATASDVAIVSWLPDSSGVTYLKFTGEHGTPSYYVNSQPRLRLLSGEDRSIPVRGRPDVTVGPNQWAPVVVSANSDTALLGIRDGRPDFAIYRMPLANLRAGRGTWEKVADFDDRIVDVSWSGDRLYLTSRKNSSNGEVLLLSAAKGTLANARKLDLAGAPVIEQLTATKSGIFVETIQDAASGLWFAADGAAPKRLTAPIAGNLAWLENNNSRDDALLSLSGWFTPGKVYHLAENGDFHDIGMVEQPSFDVGSYEAVALTAAARDGTAVPYTVIRRKGAAAGPAPLLLEAYGSYGMSQLPRFRSAMLPFLDRGGVWVLANVRGGGEFGRSWHEAGKGPTKANTWNDAIAVAEKLVADRLTTSRQMTLLGTSAGGVMVGGAVNARPDLFGGAIANVGFMNPIRYVSEQNFADIEEWGGPIADAASFQTMFNLDPYANIRKGAAYPSTLVISGINDPRAATFHSAKYAAKLAASSSSGKPVLLRIDFDAGHGGGFGSSRTQTDEQWADMLSFVLWQAGAPDFQPKN